MVALSVVDLVVSWDASTAVLLVVPMVVVKAASSVVDWAHGLVCRWVDAKVAYRTFKYKWNKEVQRGVTQVVSCHPSAK